MANFAVNANDEVITKGRELLERLARPGEKQGDVLGRIFDIVEQQEEGETMRQSGIDVQALDSSLANIRTMFLATVTGKEQIITEKDGKIAEIKELKNKMEKDLRDKLDAADAEKKAAAEQAEAAAKAAALAIKDAQAAKEQAETANRLASEKDRTIATLADKLSAAEAKIKGYDDLMQKEAAAQEQIRELHRTMEASKADHERALAAAEKDHSAAIRELQAQMERKISDAEKDAALAMANAVAEKEREFATQLRTADKENAKLQARIEILEEQASGSRNG